MREGRDDRPVVAPGGLPLVLQDASPLGLGEGRVGAALEAAGGGGLAEVDLPRARLGREPQEPVEPLGPEEVARGHGGNVGVEAGARVGAEGGQRGAERARPAPEAIVLGLVVGVQAHARSEEAALPEGAGARLRQAVARGVEDEARPVVEGAAGIGREVAIDHGAAAEGDGLFVAQIVLEERGETGVQPREWRLRGQHREKLVAAHGEFFQRDCRSRRH